VSPQWVAATAATLASAGIRNPTVYQRLAAAAARALSAVQRDPPLAAVCDEDNTAESRLQRECDRVIGEMKMGTFSPSSPAALLVAHCADTAMHSHMAEGREGSGVGGRDICDGDENVPERAGGGISGGSGGGASKHEASCDDEMDVAATDDTSWEDVLSNAFAFDDPTLPLVVDVGCGRGSFLLSLAGHSAKVFAHLFPALLVGPISSHDTRHACMVHLFGTMRILDTVSVHDLLCLGAPKYYWSLSCDCASHVCL
jgi:hypothetical protein